MFFVEWHFKVFFDERLQMISITIHYFHANGGRRGAGDSSKALYCTMLCIDIGMLSPVAVHGQSWPAVSMVHVSISQWMEHSRTVQSYMLQGIDGPEYSLRSVAVEDEKPE